MTAVTTMKQAGSWGLRLASGKDNSALSPAREIPPPSVLTVPLRQSPGGASISVVVAGQAVLKGELIATPAGGSFGSYLHAPVAGHIIEVAQTGIEPAIVIANDASETVHPDCKPLDNPLNRSPQLLRDRIAAGGIVGLGGALFPTAVKLNPAPGIGTLIINGVECEPYINCDNQLMQQEPQAVLRGTQIMLRVLGATEAVIAIEQEMIHAIESISEACAALNDPRLRVVVVPDVYPGGGERQLIETLTGRQVPRDGLPADLGIVCQNAGTAAAIDRLISTGEPLISRLLTVSGNCVSQQQNFRVRIGTPISDVIAAAGALQPERIIIGGPMMGVSARNSEQPISKASNCLLLLNDNTISKPPVEMPCIRCGDCVPVCPAGINPQLLLESMNSRNIEHSEQLGALDCIDCGCCDYVCPSGIDLTARFKIGKQAIWEQHLLGLRAERSEQRFADHKVRQVANEDAENAALGAQTAAFQDTGADSKRALNDMLRRLDSKSKASDTDDDKDAD